LENQDTEESIILKRIISEVSTETSYRVDGKGTESLLGHKILRGGIDLINPLPANVENMVNS
jgi:hypothetical protein